MAKVVRQSPSVSEEQDFRAREYFDNSVEEMLRLAGETTATVGAITAGNASTITIPVKGAVPDKGQTVHVGVPSTFPIGVTPWGYVSALNAVTLVLHNRTAGTITLPFMTYAARVMP